MKKALFLLVLFFAKCTYSQVAFVAGTKYIGEDSQLAKANWTTGLKIFYPIQRYTKKGDSTSVLISVFPGLRINWHNFKRI